MKSRQNYRLSSTLVALCLAALAFARPATAQSETVCFPTCSEVDGRFLVIATGEALQTLADQPVRVKLAVPEDQASFDIEIFDGDSGATDPEGNSHWDLLTNPVTYTLYADPNTDGSDLIEIDTFSSDEMPDNDWFTITLATDPSAAADSGNFFYLLEITPGDRDVVAVNALKVRTTGFVYFGLLDQPFAFMASWTRTTSDIPIIYPNYNPDAPLDPANLIGSSYDGTFTFYLDLQLQPGQQAIDEVAMWDGDLDRGDYDGDNLDVDDANTPNDELPFFDVNDASVFEGVAIGSGDSTGAPADDVDPLSQGGFGIYNARSPSVQYRVFSPTGSELALNANPSGNREWERFSVSTRPFDPTQMDAQVEALSAGTYKIVMEGMDMNNLNAWFFQGNVLCQRQNGESCTELPRPYVVGDLVWEDPDRNGVPNPGEPGIPGVVMNLVAADGTVLGRDLTDGEGNYLFDVDPGDYTVEVAAENFDLAGLAGGVGDRVWLDLDADGSQDGGEPGLPNVNVLLADVGADGVAGTPDDLLLEITQTDRRGRYFFGNLPAGTYYTAVDDATLAADLALSGGSDPSAVRTVLTDEVFRDLDFGYTLTDATRGMLGDFVYYDANNNGVEDAGEAGVGGVTVALMAPGDDGIFGTGDDVQVASTTTVGGYYLFSDLAPGDHQVVVTDISDVVSDLTLTASPGTLTVVAGGANLSGDFGYFSDELRSIADVVWFDTDRNGALDAGESGLGDVTVSLLNASGETILSTSTGADGSFTFDGLPDGQYTLEIVDENGVLGGLIPTTAAALAEERLVVLAGSDASGVHFGVVDRGALVGYDASTESPTQSNTVIDANVLTYDFGYFQVEDAAIGDRVWFDNDGDGVHDPGEVGIADVTLRLLDENGDLLFTTSTDGDGIYQFPLLVAGTYTVVLDEATLPPFLTQTFELDGSFDGRVTEQLDASEVNLEVDFGYFSELPLLGSIGDRVWLDEDGDGVQDPGETGIPDVTVTLKDASGTELATQVTDGNGNYLFPNLIAGDYVVCVDPSTLPDGLEPTFDRDGTLDDETPVALDPGEDVVDADFGYRPERGSIGDTIFVDENGNGVEDPGEPGIPGVTVSLKDENGNVIDATATDVDGMYLFADLAAGTYTVCVDPSTLPPSFEQTADPDGTLDDETIVALDAGENHLDADFGYRSTGCYPGDVLDAFDEVAYDNNDGLFPWLGPWVEGDEMVGGEGPTSGNVQVFSRGWLALVNKPESGQPSAQRSVSLSDNSGATLSFDFVVTSGTDVSDLAVVEISTDGGATYTVLESFVGLPKNEPIFGSREYDISAFLSARTIVRFRIDTGFSQRSERFFLDNVRVVCDCAEPGSIGDTVWQDDDRDGVQDPGEPGIPGVAVDLKDENGDLIDSMVTDANGLYLFTDLAAGTYTICVDPSTLPDGYVQTGDPDGTLDNETTIALAEGEDNLDADFGYNAPPVGSIGDTIWQDVDRDGVEEAGEPGIPGVTIQLKDASGSVIDTKVTDANGRYLFDGLAAGTYTVCVDPTSLPLGYEQTGDPDGTLDDETTVVLDAGEDRLDADFGYAPNDDPVCLPNIDFETDSNGVELALGQIVDDEFAGVTVTTNDPIDHPVMIFDSASPTGGDFDLGTPNEEFGGPGVGTGGGIGELGENSVARRKVLIISEDGSQTDPDDNGGGGTITFTFDAPVELSYLGILDIEEEGGSITAYDAVGNELISSPLAALGDNSYQVVLVPASGVSKVDVNFVSSGAVTDVVFCADLCVYNWNGPGGRAFYMPEISKVLAFEPEPGSWQEQEGGRATIRGEITDQNAPGEQGFVVNVQLSGRYTDGHFVFYADWSGTLVGTGNWQGAHLEIEGTGADFQLGYGANQKDDDLGVSGWFNWTTVQQPDSGYLPATGKGDINADIADCVVAGPCAPKSYRDEFDRVSFDNQDGPNLWSGPWLEDDVAGSGPVDGNVWIAGSRLKLNDLPDTGTEPSAARTADLSGLASATLSLTYSIWNVEDTDTAVVEISADGGATYTALETFTGIEGTIQEDTRSYNISAYISATTTVRVRIADYFGGSNEYFKIHDIEISGGCEPHVCEEPLNVHDQFDVPSYGNNDGDDSWNGRWIELDPEGGEETGGQVRITDGWLRLDDAPDSGTDPSVQRSVDLSAFADGAGSCQLSFHWCTDHGVDSDDAAVLEISTDGGISFTTLKEYTGYTGLVQGHDAIDISAYAAEMTTIRFRINHKYGGDDEYFYLDDVDITCSCS